MTSKLKKVGWVESKNIHAFEAYDRNDLTEVYKARYPVDGKLYSVKVLSNITLNNLTIEDIFKEFPPLELFGESVSNLARSYEYIVSVPKRAPEGIITHQPVYGHAVAKIYGIINKDNVTYYGVSFEADAGIIARCMRNAIAQNQQTESK